LRTLIVDDERLARVDIYRTLTEYPGTEIVGKSVCNGRTSKPLP